MLKIQIDIEHPFTILLVLGSVVTGVLVASSLTDTHRLRADSLGGPEVQQVVALEQDVSKLRTLQAVLAHKEEILRYQVLLLEQQSKMENSISAQQELAESINQLRTLLMDQKKAEEHIRLSLRQMWDAEGRALAVNAMSLTPLKLSWPFDPIYEVSAGFQDAGYHERFGLVHNGIDIPIEQGSVVRATADGIVENVSDNGYGFNSLLLRHDGGATMYGHVSMFLVSEGQYVRRGDPIALSGGRPGSPGAGALSTGPHLHLEVVRDGVRQDPVAFLPDRESFLAAR